MATYLEAGIQKAFFQWLELQHPRLRPLCFAIPNGGRRNPAEAYHMKLQGVTAGVPDVMLAYPSLGYHGLFIEFKARTHPTPQQRNMLDRLAAQGYRCCVCYDVTEAMAVLASYLGEKDVQQSAVS